jgi:hypothetical protein
MPDKGHLAGREGNRWLTIALAGLACSAVELAVRGLHGPVDTRAFAAGVTVIVGIVITVGEVLRRTWPVVGGTPRSRLGWVGGFVAVAVSIEMAVRSILGDPLLLDGFLLIALRDVVIALMVVAHHPAARPACVGFATFLVVFASASAHAIWAQGFVVSFAVIGVCWLVGTHWERLEQRLEASSRQSLPRRWLLTLPLGVLGALLFVPVSARPIRQADGFMPTSGGQRDASSAATSGVGDGDALVAGLDNIRSFAPIENAPFMTSHEPSLYDIFDDTYNEPAKKRKTDRAISLANQDRSIRPEDHSMATSRRPGREFSTVRRPGKPSRRRIADLDSRAILQVKGRVPVHLKLESFDRYDGVAWQPEETEARPGNLSLKTVGDRAWAVVAPGIDVEIDATPEVHALRIIRLDTNRIPAPERLTAVHLDHLDRADLFRWAQPGILRMDREKLPDLLTVHVQSRPVDRWRLTDRFPLFQGGPEGCRDDGDGSQSRAVKALVESWIGETPRGWRQIERVVTRIREGYTLDPAARASPECTHSAAEFLLETRRGPDYLFASATVCALRSLGYSARLVSGFYADPKHYDARSGHTAVMPDDVHVWAEVYAGWGRWVTLEPTPGYTLLAPRHSLLAHLARGCRLTVAALIRHPFPALAALVFLVAAVRHRRFLADIVDEALWRLRSPGHGETCSPAAVVAAVRLLDRRCSRAGLPRPRHLTPARWLGIVHERIAAAAPTAAKPAVAQAFVRAADVALYAPAATAPCSPASVKAAPAVWSWRHLTATRRLFA